MKTKTKGRPSPQAHAELAQRIGATARAARLNTSLTQVDVAERVRLSGEVYGRLERGTMLPSVPTLRRLSVVLGVSSDVALGLAEERSEECRKPLDDGLSPELRLLLRNVRRLDPEQLKLFRMIANALSNNGQKGAQESESEDLSQVGT